MLIRKKVKACIILVFSSICVLRWNYGSIEVDEVHLENYVDKNFQKGQVKDVMQSNITDGMTMFPPVPTALSVNSTYDIGENSLRIYFWTGWTPSAPFWWMLTPGTSMVECGDVTCQYTNATSLYEASHGILFFFNHKRLGSTLDKEMFPKTRYPRQYWIAHYQDNPRNQRFENMASFNDLFNLSSNFHSQSDVPTPYGVCQRSYRGETLLPNYSEGKTGLVSWIVSHCNTWSKREEYVEMLGQHVNVSVYGHCKMQGYIGTLCRGKNMRSRNCDDARHIMNSHKFYLAFENVICADYATEKLFKVLQTNMRTIPVVRNGVKNLKDLLPPHSYIDTRDFDSPKELADYLQLLDNNDELYNEYFAWRANYTCELEWIPCTLCRSFHKVYGKQETLYKDTSEIFSGDKNCEAMPSDIPGAI